MMLPFQLVDSLRWVTIPGTIFAAYIILGIAAIGREIENPSAWMSTICPSTSIATNFATDIDIILAPQPQSRRISSKRSENLVLFRSASRAMMRGRIGASTRLGRL